MWRQARAAITAHLSVSVPSLHLAVSDRAGQAASAAVALRAGALAVRLAVDHADVCAQVPP